MPTILVLHRVFHAFLDILLYIFGRILELVDTLTEAAHQLRDLLSAEEK